MRLTIFPIVLIFLTFPVFSAEKVPTLKSVMQGLEKSMNKLSRGIFYEEFNVIEEAAFGIAKHPKPKNQLPIVVKTLNKRMPKFKYYDSKVHGAAVDIIEFAKKRDMDNILKKHKVIMNSCVACHTQFRSEISRVLSN